MATATETMWTVGEQVVIKRIGFGGVAHYTRATVARLTKNTVDVQTEDGAITKFMANGSRHGSGPYSGTYITKVTPAILASLARSRAANRAERIAEIVKRNTGGPAPAWGIEDAGKVAEVLESALKQLQALDRRQLEPRG